MARRRPDSETMIRQAIADLDELLASDEEKDPEKITREKERLERRIGWFRWLEGK